MTEQLPLSLITEQDFLFENFVPGSNIELLTQLMQLPMGQAIYIFGETSSGKSHLLHATATQFHGLYLNAQNLSESRLAWVLDPHASASHTYPVVVVDDLDRLSPEQQTLLFNLFNEWKAKQHSSNAFSLVVAGSQAPQNMVMREDLRNRLGWGLIYKLEALTQEDITLAIQQRTFDKGVRINEEACQWLFNHTDRHIRSINRWIDALDLYSIAKRRPLITVPLIKEFLECTPQPPTPYYSSR